MKTASTLRTTALFVALTVAGILLIVLPIAVPAQEAIRQTLPLVGSALFASALTFFLVETTRQEKGK